MQTTGMSELSAFGEVLKNNKKKGLKTSLVAKWVGTRSSYINTLAKEGIKNADWALQIFYHIQAYHPDINVTLADLIWPREQQEAMQKELQAQARKDKNLKKNPKYEEAPIQSKFDEFLL